MLALPGSAYVYQGDELGLPEVEDIPDDARQDPVFLGSERADPGRDGSRVPLPWSSATPSYGFSPDGADAEPWLPQPQDWAGLAAETQADDPSSTLLLYAEALRIRRERLATLSPITWIPSPPDVVAFRRAGIECWLNAGTQDVPLPVGASVLLASSPGTESGVLPRDSAAWVAVD
jgi:alpha-glucosidase